MTNLKIPKTITNKGRTYTFVQVCNNNMFLYKNDVTGANETFSRYDLRLIDNTVIDKKLDIKKCEGVKVNVYDRLFEKETIYNSLAEAANQLNVSVSTIFIKIKEKKWLNNRYFIERIEE